MGIGFMPTVPSIGLSFLVLGTHHATRPWAGLNAAPSPD